MDFLRLQYARRINNVFLNTGDQVEGCRRNGLRGVVRDRCARKITLLIYDEQKRTYTVHTRLLRFHPRVLERLSCSGLRGAKTFSAEPFSTHRHPPVLLWKCREVRSRGNLMLCRIALLLVISQLEGEASLALLQQRGLATVFRDHVLRSEQDTVSYKLGRVCYDHVVQVKAKPRHNRRRNQGVVRSF